MGSSASKTAASTTRKFPTRVPGSAVPPASMRHPQPRQVGQQLPPSAEHDSAILASDATGQDTRNLAFSERLRKMGVAQPNPTFSPSSTAEPEPDLRPQGPPRPLYPSATNNPTLSALKARQSIQQRAEEEFEGLGRKNSPGRQFLDASTIARILALRENGASPRDIESQLDLQPGLVNKLGRPGVATSIQPGS